jgi:hypothetical protein
MRFPLARGLTLLGIALAVAELATPSRSPELIGTGHRTRLRRSIGGNKFASAIALAGMRRRRGSRWSRAAGTVADVAMIATALGPRARRLSALGALAAVAATSALRAWRPSKARVAR